MKANYSISLIFLVVLLGCKSPKDIQPTIDSELKSYYDLFVKEGLARGLSTDFLKTNAVIQLGKVSKPYVGIADYKANTITIDSIFWRQNKGFEPSRKFVMFHELGHLILRRDHDNSLLPNGEYKTMMFTYDNNPSLSYIYFFGIRQKYYTDELFDAKTIFPEWSKKEYNPDRKSTRLNSSHVD